MKILVLALSGIGDALMFTPALRLLRQRFAEASIDVLVMYRGASDIFERNPCVNRVLHWDFLREGAVRSLKYLLHLRGSYDVTLNVYPSNRREYNVVQYLIGAERRLGVRYLRGDRTNFGFLNNGHVDEDDALHNVEENVRLVSLLTGPVAGPLPDLEFPLLEGDRETARRDLELLGIREGEPVVGFHPGCSTLKNHEKRRWEPDKFAELARNLVRRDNCRVLVFGGSDEDELKEQVCRLAGLPGVVNVRTRSLAHTAALMARCTCFVTNDSSLMHVAAALKRNVVAIIGPTNPSYIRPWNTPHVLVRIGLECSPCFVYSPKPLTCTRRDVLFKCVREISVDQVYDAAKAFLRP